MQVLIIEDEHKTAAFICRGLAEDGFQTEVVHNGRDGLEKAIAGNFDLILLDVMLPVMDGWEVLRRLRASDNDTPVILLTVLDGLEERTRAVELGADGFLAKPFSFSELVRGIKEVRRQEPIEGPGHLRVADLEIDAQTQGVCRGGTEIRLNTKEFALLSLLAEHHGQLLTPARIAERIWHIEVGGETALVDSHVCRLRSKVDGPFGKELIHHVRGRGYVLEER